MLTQPALLTILILAGGGGILLLAGRWLRPRWIAWSALALALGAVVPLFLPHGPLEVVLSEWLLGPGWAIGLVYRFDALAQALALFAAFPALLLLLWMGLGAGEEEGIYAPWVLVLLALVLHVFISADLLLIYVGWELVILATYFLLTYRRATLPTPGIAEWFLGGQFLAGFALLFALLGLGQSAGTWQYAHISLHPIPLLALVLLLVTAWVRMALVPFQGWALAAAESSGPVSTLLLGSSVLLPGPYLWLRFLELGSEHTPHDVAMIAGCAGLLLGSVLALRQESGRRVQAGDTVARLGLVWVALGLDSSLGVAAALFLLFDLLLSKVVFHLALSARGPGRPLRQLLFLIGVWGGVGLPPSWGFVGRWLLVMGLIAAGRAFYLPFLLLAVPLALAYLWRGWTLLPESTGPTWRWERIAQLALAALVGLSALGGLAAPWLGSALVGSAAGQVLRESIDFTTIDPLSVNFALGQLAGWLPAWTVVLLVIAGLGAWWSGSLPTVLAVRKALGSPPSPPLPAAGEKKERALLSEGPLQEAMPVLPQETGWLAWIGRPVPLPRLFGQVTGILGVALHGLVNFLERHTTYFVLVVLVAAAVVLIVLTR